MESVLVDHLTEAKDLKKSVEGCFLLAFIWGIAGATEASGRRRFDSFFKRLVSGCQREDDAWGTFVQSNPSYKDAQEYPFENKVPFVESGSCVDYGYDAVKSTWFQWIDKVPKFIVKDGMGFQDILVPTVDTSRNGWLIQRLVEHNMPVLCTGETGTGKSVSIKSSCARILTMASMFLSRLNFSAQTSANQTQDIIDGKLDKRRRGIYGPPLGKRCVIFVDDLNMPAKEEYGAQPPIEILRQWMDHEGWYDRKEITFRRLVDIQFVAAMGPPGVDAHALRRDMCATSRS